jgi:hypothetical protein
MQSVDTSLKNLIFRTLSALFGMIDHGMDPCEIADCAIALLTEVVLQPLLAGPPDAAASTSRSSPRPRC